MNTDFIWIRYFQGKKMQTF